MSGSPGPSYDTKTLTSCGAASWRLSQFVRQQARSGHLAFGRPRLGRRAVARSVDHDIAYPLASLHQPRRQFACPPAVLAKSPCAVAVAVVGCCRVLGAKALTVVVVVALVTRR